MEKKAGFIVVLGSLNIDLFLEVHRMPVLGETMQTEGVIKGFGGKVSYKCPNF
jgi:sugar/nucleoside kinase (ribokinase family)